MTEETTTTTTTEAQGARCRMGSKMPKPCPFPATESHPDDSPDNGPTLCAFHAALMPLSAEADWLGVSLELTRTYLKAVRRQPAALQLEEVLEHAEADFERRVELILGTINDLKAAEYELIR